jgi:hypothetical protein
MDMSNPVIANLFYPVLVTLLVPIGCKTYQFIQRKYQVSKLHVFLTQNADNTLTIREIAESINLSPERTKDLCYYSKKITHDDECPENQCNIECFKLKTNARLNPCERLLHKTCTTPPVR